MASPQRQPDCQLGEPESVADSGAIAVAARSSKWSRRYGRRHGFRRVPDQAGLKNGRRGRVTIYQRGAEPDHRGQYRYVLSWCAAGRRRKESLTGDCFTAVARADEINCEIDHQKATGAPQDSSLTQLVDAFIEHMNKRADAGDIAPATPRRYQSALGHLLDFEPDPRAERWEVSRDFVLGLKAHLMGKQIAPNGHANACHRPLKQAGIAYILAATSALIRWSVAEGLLPGASLTAVPHLRIRRQPARLTKPLPITAEQAVRLLDVARDVHERLPIALMMFHGLRPSEAVWLMAERVDLENGWITYAGIEELGYRTKGNTEKRLPIPDLLRTLLEEALNGRQTGPVLLRRKAGTGEASLEALCEQVREARPRTWTARQSAGRAALRAAGGLDSDDLRRLFRRLAKQAGLDTRVTPKALRHLFATALEQAGIGYYTRRYMLGHSASERGRLDVTAAYTHVDDVSVRVAHDAAMGWCGLTDGNPLMRALQQ